MNLTKLRIDIAQATRTQSPKLMKQIASRISAMTTHSRIKLLKGSKKDYLFVLGLEAGLSVNAPGDLPEHFDGDGCQKCQYPGCRNVGHWGYECWVHSESRRKAETTKNVREALEVFAADKKAKPNKSRRRRRK